MKGFVNSISHHAIIFLAYTLKDVKQPFAIIVNNVVKIALDRPVLILYFLHRRGRPLQRIKTPFS